MKVESVNSTTIHVQWRAPNRRERNGQIRGYYVYYARVNDNGDVMPKTEQREDISDENRNEIVIVALHPDTKYSVTVAAYTRKGDGIRSKPPQLVSTKGAGKRHFLNIVTQNKNN